MEEKECEAQLFAFSSGLAHARRLFYLQRVCQSHHSLLKQRQRRPIAPAFRQTERGREGEGGRGTTSIVLPRLGPWSKVSVRGRSSAFFSNS